MRNLATSLFEHGAITTTEAKARVLRPYAERLITKAKRGDLHNRRQVMTVIRDKTVVHMLFTEIGPRFADRPGGYTRITKLGPRKGDNAPMAVIELVEAEFTPKVRSSKPAAAATLAPEPEVEADETVTDEAAISEVESVDADADAAAAEDTADEVVADAEPTVDESAAEEPAAEVSDEAAPVAEETDAEIDAEAAVSEVESVDADADAAAEGDDESK